MRCTDQHYENLYTSWSREDIYKWKPIYRLVQRRLFTRASTTCLQECKFATKSEYGGAVLQWGLRREICMLLLHQWQSWSPFLERSFWTSTLYCKLVSLSAAGIPMLDLIYVMFLYFHIQTANESQVSLHTSSLYSSKNVIIPLLSVIVPVSLLYISMENMKNAQWWICMQALTHVTLCQPMMHICFISFMMSYLTMSLGDENIKHQSFSLLIIHNMA